MTKKIKYATLTPNLFEFRCRNLNKVVFVKDLLNNGFQSVSETEMVMVEGGSSTPPGVEPGPAPDDAGQISGGGYIPPRKGGSGPILTPDPKFKET